MAVTGRGIVSGVDGNVASEIISGERVTGILVGLFQTED